MLRRRLVALSLVAITALPLGACVPKFFSLLPIEMQVFFIYVIRGQFKDRARQRVNTTVSLELDASVSGVPDGTYDITIRRPSDSAVLGTFSGSAKIKRGRFVAFTVKNTDELKAAVGAILRETDSSADFEVSKAIAVVKGSQQPGGVNAKASVTIKFNAEAVEGDRTGAKIRNGKLKFSFTEPD